MQSLQIRSPSGDLLAEWPYARARSLLRRPRAFCASVAPGAPAPPASRSATASLAAAFDAHAGAVRRVGAIDRRSRVKVVGWSLAALVSAVLVAIFGVPAIVSRLTPLVPIRVEQRLGASVDQQVRMVLDPGHTRPSVRVRQHCGASRPCCLRQARAPIGGSRHPAVQPQRRRDSPAGSECHCASGRARLRVPGSRGQGEQSRRAGRRHRPRDGTRRPARRRAGR